MASRILCTCGPRPPANQPRRAKYFVRDPDERLRPVCRDCGPRWSHNRPSAAGRIPLKEGYREYIAQLVMTE